MADEKERKGSSLLSGMGVGFGGCLGIVAFIILLIILAGILGSGTSNESESSATSQGQTSTTNGTTENDKSTAVSQESQKEQDVPVVKVSAEELSEAYEANQVAADQKYKGKILEVTGVVDSIGKDILDDPYITLKGSGYFSGIQCMFKADQEDKLADIVKDQNLTVRGKVSGDAIVNVILKDCSL